jgi:hypothetical protein
MRWKRKKEKNMNATVANNFSLSEFIKQNKEKIYETARKNTKLNSEGKPTISKDDDWFYEDEWDRHFERNRK